MFDVFIGYDPSEETAFNVARTSLQKEAAGKVRVQRVSMGELRVRGLYQRAATRDADGHRIDTVDGLPFSTEFAFTRFLVPFMTHRRWALFCDSDFLFRANIQELNHYLDPSYALLCVKHNYAPKEKLKMTGQVQSVYPRKNWSSFMLWNLGHPAHRLLTIHDVNNRPGRWLHTFQWLKEEEIGALPEEWNWLEGSSPLSISPKAVHFTRGVPTHAGMENASYADEWRRYLGHGGFNNVGGTGKTPS